MTGPLNHATLIDELDARQDEVLRDLDELNLRVEKLLNSCLPARNEPTPESGELPLEGESIAQRAAA